VLAACQQPRRLPVLRLEHVDFVNIVAVAALNFRE
tara:strand:+ start:1633 stop:1737 length:105 start_codon:yes stop_codon:yes gene_type:complete